MAAPPTERRFTGRKTLRLGLAALAICYAVLAWGSGFDRASWADPQRERLVPGPLRADADAALARSLLLREEFAGLLPIAEQAVRRDPIDRDPAALLGAARLAAGDNEGADAAFRVAAQLGWRQPLTQLYWMEAALASGEWSLAALRADAVLRDTPDYVGASPLLARFEADPQGRAALAERLRERPDWLSSYLETSSATPRATLENRALVLGLLAGDGAVLGCDTAAPFVERLVTAGLFAAAARVWQAHCPDAAGDGAGIADGGFERLQLSGKGDPLGWQPVRNGDISARLAGEPGNRALRLSSSAIAAQPVLFQPVRLPPGPISMAWTARDTGGAASDRIDISIDCGDASRPPLQGANRRTLHVPDCEAQKLRVWLAPGEGPVILDNIRIEQEN